MIWLVLLAAAMIVGGVVVLVVVLSKNRKAQKPFEPLPAEKPDDRPYTPPEPSVDYVGNNDLTRKLFDTDLYGSTLRSYVLELYDLRRPGQGYRVNVSDRITIGRGSGCTVCIPNRTLSGEHCEIVLNNGKLFLRDLNSLNGTYLNGNPNRVTEAYLDSGSIIQIGSEKLQIQLKEVNG